LYTSNTRLERLAACLALPVVALLALMTVQACTPSSQAIAGGGQEATVGVNVGELAPDFTLTDLEGKRLRLSNFRGKVVLINFWATWCPACRAEMPEIEAIYQEYKDKGVAVIGVDIRETEEDVRRYVQQGGFSWSFVLDTTGEVAATYRITAIPAGFLVDKDGTIRAVRIDAMTKRAVEAKLAAAMR